MSTRTIIPSRANALRLALGAALAHQDTAKLSNRMLAKRFGCSETTVRRYRKIADTIGLTASMNATTPLRSVRVPTHWMDEARKNANFIIKEVEGDDTETGRFFLYQAELLLRLIAESGLKDDGFFIFVRSENLMNEFECYTPSPRP